MAQTKTLKRIEEKLDRVLLLMESDAMAGQMFTGKSSLDPEAVAASIDYDTYTAEEIIGRAESLSEAERAALHEYETRNKARKTVLEALSQ